MNTHRKTAASEGEPVIIGGAAGVSTLVVSYPSLDYLDYRINIFSLVRLSKYIGFK